MEHSRLAGWILALAALAPTLAAEPAWRTEWRAAAEAAQAGDSAGARARLDATLAARPDYPRALLARARLLATDGNLDGAVLALEAYALRGLATDLAASPAFASLPTHPRHAALAERLAANAAPTGSAPSRFALPAQSGILEAVARDADGAFYFTDVRQRCVWRRAPDGHLARFDQPATPLGGCFALALDPARGVLWVATSAVPEMLPPADGATPFTGVVALDLRTGRETHRLPLEQPDGDHVLGSLRLGPDGALYATDSAAPVVWRAERDAGALTPWIRHDDFLSLQGLAFTDGGAALHLADYANGLWTVDTASRVVRRVEPAADACLFGIDELLTAGGDLVAVQNGLAPTRIVRVRIVNNVASVEVLARGLPGLDDASTGLLDGDSLLVIGGSGWSLFTQPGEVPAPRDVPLLALALPAAP